MDINLITKGELLKNEIKVPLNQIYFSYPRVNEAKIDEVKNLDMSGDLFRELLAIFAAEFVEKLPLLDDSLKNEKFFDLSEMSHRLRSTSYNVGAIRIGEILKKIEIDSLGRTEEIDKEELSLLISSLKVEQQASLNELLKFATS
jgi:HPt (histidine-containing phosphotransfer) domain-containing protein